MKTIILIRHGECETNVKKILNSDPNIIYPLTQNGVKQAEEAAQKLKEIPIDCIFSSQVHRAKETAKIINSYHNLEIREDERINELNTGLEGESVFTYLKLKEESEDMLHFKINGGESHAELKIRINEFLEKQVLSSLYSTIVIVSHGDPIVAMREILLEKRFSTLNDLSYPQHCKIMIFVEDK